MGNKSRLAGRQFEALLDTLHNYYRGQGMAYISHNGLQAQRTGRGGRHVITMKSQPDYTGVMGPGGIFVAFDAKSSSRPYYYHAPKQAHQLRFLWNVHQMGGAAFLLVYVRAEVMDDDMAWMLWPRPSWESGEGYKLSLRGRRPVGAEIAVQVPPLPGSPYIPDWLSVVDRRLGIVRG